MDAAVFHYLFLSFLLLTKKERSLSLQITNWYVLYVIALNGLCQHILLTLAIYQGLNPLYV